MSTQSIACAACGAPVPYGRLACPACGELLASVAGMGRRVVVGASVGGTRVGSLTDMDANAPATAVPAMPEGLAAIIQDATTTSASPPPLMVGSAVADDDAPLAASPPPTAYEPLVAEEAGHEGDLADLDDVDDVDDDEDDRYGGLPVVAARSTMAIPDVLQPVDASAPGAYVPPAPIPAGPAAPARAWAGTNGATAGAAAAGGSAAVVVDGSASADGTAPRFAGLDRETLQEWAGWLAVGGAALALIGFVLPWAATMIGSPGIDYIDRWGLAGPGHPFVVLGLLAVLALALLHNPIPLWLRIGLPGVILGTLLLGLVWPYLWSDVLGTTLGVYVAALGAVLLLIAGVVALVSDRHADGARPV
jgi:hypothetical protein